VPSAIQVNRAATQPQDGQSVVTTSTIVRGSEAPGSLLHRQLSNNAHIVTSHYKFM
jgi:hypothetical protein